MSSSAGTRPTRTPPPDRVTWSDGAVVLRDERLFGPGAERACERFLVRALMVAGVRSVTLERSHATATIRYGAARGFLGEVLAHARKGARHGAKGPPPWASPQPGFRSDGLHPLTDADRDFLQRLAAALGAKGDDEPLPALPRGVGEATCTLYRHGALLTTCEIVSDRPGRLRLRHEELRRDHTLARQAEGLLTMLAGVHRATFGSWTESLAVHYDPARLAPAAIIRHVEELLDRSGGWGGALPAATKTRFALPNITLGTAALADFVVPALMPVSAALLIGTNLRTFRVAWLQVQRRKFGLPVLYTTIVIATLASGQFVASAVMSWFFKFWQGRLRNELASERRRLLDACIPLPRHCRLATPAGSEVLIPVDRLRKGDRVDVASGQPIPADGRVIDGGAIVDERSVRGRGGASRKRAGDTVLAGSHVLAGTLRVEVMRPVTETRATKIGRALVAASSPAAGPVTATLRAEEFAERTVAPTLATAGLGFLVGDLAAAGAILRPDYATGPALAFPLETLRDAALCARKGIVVRTPDAFERLAQVDLIVLDDDIDLGRLELEVAGIETRLPESELLRLAASTFRHLDDDRAAALANACRQRGLALLDLPPVGFEPGVTVVHGTHRLRVREYPSAPDGLHPLVVEADGSVIGLIRFARSARPTAGSALGRIRALGPVTISLVSARSPADAAARAALLGLDLHVGKMSPADTARLLRDCRARGLRTAFIGRGRHRPEAAAAAYIAVSVVDDDDLDAESAAVLLLQPRLEPFADLWEIARSHEQRLRILQRLIVVPNVLCVAGAFFLGTTALTAAMITNLGTFGLYSSAVGALQAVGPAGRGRSGPLH